MSDPWKPIIEQDLLVMPTPELEEIVRLIKAEISALEERLPRLENELFYRNYPECRI